MPSCWWETKASDCSRHSISRNMVETRVKRWSIRGTAFLFYILHTGSLDFHIHLLWAVGTSDCTECHYSQSRICLSAVADCLASCVMSLTCGLLSSTPVCCACTHSRIHLLLQPWAPEISNHCLGRAAQSSLDSA